jgi:hypothetical protein
MLRLLLLVSLAVVMLSACAPPALDQQVTDEQLSEEITVYRSPT